MQLNALISQRMGEFIMPKFEVLGKMLCAYCGVDHQLFEVIMDNEYKFYLCNYCTEELDDSNEDEHEDS